MPGNIERLTFMESKILELGKRQHEKGYQGGAFTPGFIRKETEYGYRAINIALEALIGRGLVEKSVTSTFRNGSVVELDVYKITDKGLRVVDDIKAGAVQINGREPPIQPNQRPVPAPQPRAYSKPWDSPRQDRHHDQRPESQELVQTVQAMQATMSSMAEEIKMLHEKLDHILRAHPHAGAPAAASPAPAPAARPETAPAGKRKPRALTKEALFHRQLVLRSVTEAGKLHDVVLAEDVKSAYQDACKTAGVQPKGAAQFTTFLKRMQSEGLLGLRRAGCKALGIKGQGTRVAVTLTPDGEKMAVGRR